MPAAQAYSCAPGRAEKSFLPLSALQAPESGSGSASIPPCLLLKRAEGPLRSVMIPKTGRRPEMHQNLALALPNYASERFVMRSIWGSNSWKLKANMHRPNAIGTI